MPAHKQSSLLLLLLVTTFFFVLLRVFQLHETFKLGSDEGRDFLVVWEIVHEQKFKLIGPPSEYTLNGQQFHFGPAPYYAVIPAMLLGNWSPLAVSYFLIGLNLTALLVFVIVAEKYLQNRQLVIIFATLFTFTPALVTYTRYYWNPYFMLPVSMVLLSLLIMNNYQPKKSLLLIGGIGFLLGLGLQFHYGYILVIIGIIIWLGVKMRVSLQTFGILVIGGSIGFAPVIIYELVTNFYNLRTMLAVFQNIGTSEHVFSFHSFYIIGLIPFYLFAVSLMFSLFAKYSPKVSIVLLGIFCLYSLFILLHPQKISMNISYSSMQKIAETITRDNAANFNIVDQLTSDNRAMAIRYLVTKNGKKPNGVTEYEKSDTLDIYSRVPIAVLLNNPVWEISSFHQGNVSRTWKFDDGITLYKVEK